jgi:catechol 2,3-dioxygenase-like lactoylglutathione lyase family enzyme
MPSFPRLIVNDIGASTAFYVDALGFSPVFTMPGPGGTPSLVHLRWIKYADLLLVPDRDGSLSGVARGEGVSLNFGGPTDVDALAGRAQAHGARIVEGPVDRPWNVRELVILDPDGYRLVFNGYNPDGPHRSFDEIVAGAARGFRP